MCVSSFRNRWSSPKNPLSQDEMTPVLSAWYLLSWNPLKDWCWLTWRTWQAPCWTPYNLPSRQIGRWRTQSKWHWTTFCNTSTIQGHIQGSCLWTSVLHSTPSSKKLFTPNWTSSLWKHPPVSRSKTPKSHLAPKQSALEITRDVCSPPCSSPSPLMAATQETHLVNSWGHIHKQCESTLRELLT